MVPILPPSVKVAHRAAKKQGRARRASCIIRSLCTRRLCFGKPLPCQTGFDTNENPHYWNGTSRWRDYNAMLGSYKRMCEDNVFSHPPPLCKF